jgi:hypothetical protein
VLKKNRKSYFDILSQNVSENWREMMGIILRLAKYDNTHSDSCWLVE